MATSWYEADRHEAGRIIAFSDGVVAIAITLLILPLAALELPHDGQGAVNPLGYIWQQNSSLIMSFLITWAIIIVFWLVHHRIFGMLAQVNNRIIMFNILWLFGIVVLPFPMNLVDQVSSLDVATSAARQVITMYIATMFVISFSMSMISEQIRGNPDLLTERAQTKPRATRLTIWAFTGYLACTTIFALFLPQWALWALLGLAVVRPAVDAVSDKRTPKPPPSTESSQRARAD